MVFCNYMYDHSNLNFVKPFRNFMICSIYCRSMTKQKSISFKIFFNTSFGFLTPKVFLPLLQNLRIKIILKKFQQDEQFFQIWLSLFVTF